MFYSYSAFPDYLYSKYFGSESVSIFSFLILNVARDGSPHLHLFIYFTILYSVYKTDKDWMRAMGWFIVGNIAVTAQAVLQALGQKKSSSCSRLYSTKLVEYINAAYPTSMGNNLRLDSTLVTPLIMVYTHFSSLL